MRLKKHIRASERKPMNKIKDVVIGATVSTEEKKKVLAACRKERITQTQFIRNALEKIHPSIFKSKQETEK